MLQRILVPLDGSALAEQAVPHATALAKAFGSSIILARVPETLIVPVMSGGTWVTREIESHEAHDRAEEYLTDIRSRIAREGLDVTTVMAHHPVAKGLIKAVDESRAGLVVMTTHGQSGIGRWVLGSVAEKLVRAAPTPVYLIRTRSDGDASAEPQEWQQREPELRRIVAPLDGSELAEVALESASALATATDGEVLLVRVPTLPGYVTAIPETAGWIPDLLRETALESETYLSERVAALRRSGINASGEVELVVQGSVAEGILSYAEKRQADVIVMSTHGRSGVSRWVFGSVAERVLRAADIPVWLVRAGTPSEAA